jgi:hypothetical protein
MIQQLRLVITKEAAIAAHAKPQTLLKHYCEKGHYYGVKPIKLPSRLLLWNLAEIEALSSGAPR